MKKIVGIIWILVIMAGTSMAQNVMDGVYVKEHVPERKVVPYAFLREADVMWSKRVWRVLDLNEKINHPLKYPVSKSTKDRRNLIDVVMDAAAEGTLTAYKPTDDDDFTVRMTPEEFEKIGGAGVDTLMVPSPDPPYDPVQTIVKREFSRDWVMAYRIKEDWFFDKQRSVLDVRIIGIAPLMYSRDDKGNLREPLQTQPLFWVYFPEARKVFANAEVFNRYNDAERKTYDDIFWKRMFSSYVTKESNVMNRRIQDYMTGMDALLEAERVKEDIFNMEHDLWEF